MAILAPPHVRSLAVFGLPGALRGGHERGPMTPMAVQPEHWDVTQAAYGSAGTATITIALRGGDAQPAGLPGAVAADQLVENLVHAARNGPVSLDLYVGRPPSPLRWDSGDLAQVFSGYLDLTEWEFETDTVKCTARDATSLLMDSRTLTNFPNQTPDQIAAQFARDVGLTPVVTPVKDAHGAPILAGHYYELDTIHVGFVPRQKWDVLLYLARSVGYDVYVTPRRELVFGPPPSTSVPPVVFSWLDPTAPPGTALLRCKITHSPRRNRTFKVLVKSYHPKTAQLVTGSAVVLGVTVPITSVKTISAGTYRGQGPAGSTIFNELGSALEGHPVYQFHVAGLTPQQAQARAEAISQNIARHELVADIAVEGTTSITPQSSLSFRGLGHGMDAQPFYPQRVRHLFQMGQGGGEGQGWITELTALNIPPSAVDDPSQAIFGS